MKRLRIGVVNLMPRAEVYEASLVRALGPDVELVWLALESHCYSSSDPARVATYQRFAAVVSTLDGLILTGAPVEELPYAEVKYWPELSANLTTAYARGLPTLGICWGGMVLASMCGIGKIMLPEKLSGVFEHRVAPCDISALGPVQVCPQSRHAALDPQDVARAQRAGRVEIVADSARTGPTILRSTERTLLMHLGHPEYDEQRLLFEWDRDSAAGRTDVREPAGYDLVARRPRIGWQPDSRRFFEAWKDEIRASAVPWRATA